MPFNQEVIEAFTEPDALSLPANAPEERVVLVNEHDEPIGIEDKSRAHLLGTLHRAFSVFILNPAGQLLLQKRALTKYHSRGLWSNTCCGHPRPHETISHASRRRLREEMGFESNLREVFSFLYRANLEDGLIENELDHVLVGQFEGVPAPNPSEISEWRWVDVAGLSVDLRRNPENYTCWFRISFDRFLRVLQSPQF
jgi:isopentenyl-diphosphate delta-isomerase